MLIFMFYGQPYCLQIFWALLGIRKLKTLLNFAWKMQIIFVIVLKFSQKKFLLPRHADIAHNYIVFFRHLIYPTP